MGRIKGAPSPRAQATITAKQRAQINARKKRWCSPPRDSGNPTTSWWLGKSREEMTAGSAEATARRKAHAWGNEVTSRPGEGNGVIG